MFPGGAGNAPGQVSVDCSKVGDAGRRVPVFPNGVNVSLQDVSAGGPKLAICTSTSAGLDQVGVIGGCDISKRWQILMRTVVDLQY